MKKYGFSDNKKSKSSKGFYAALGISAVMIGSACLFAYNQGEKLKEKDFAAETSQTSETVVDKKSTDIPKAEITTAARITETKPVTTVAAVSTEVKTTAAPATIPAAAISTSPVSETKTEAAKETVSDKTPEFAAPLSDMSSILNTFSGKELVKNPTTGSWQTHNGVDIGAVIGSDVFAADSGEVTAVNSDPLWGTTVSIDHHNGYITKYCSLAPDLNVQEGDAVEKGSTIGTVGDSADIESSVDPHIHFELIHNGSFEDPLSFIKKT